VRVDKAGASVVLVFSTFLITGHASKTNAQTPPPGDVTILLAIEHGKPNQEEVTVHAVNGTPQRVVIDTGSLEFFSRDVSGSGYAPTTLGPCPYRGGGMSDFSVTVDGKEIPRPTNAPSTPEPTDEPIPAHVFLDSAASALVGRRTNRSGNFCDGSFHAHHEIYAQITWTFVQRSKHHVSRYSSVSPIIDRDAR